MTREEKLTTMRAKDLIDLAISLGVKVNTNTAKTSLKEARAKVIAKIIAAETNLKCGGDSTGLDSDSQAVMPVEPMAAKSSSTPELRQCQKGKESQDASEQDYTKDMSLIKKLVEASAGAGDNLKESFAIMLNSLPEVSSVTVEPVIDGAYKVKGKRITCIAVPFVGGLGVVYPTGCNVIPPETIIEWGKAL